MSSTGVVKAGYLIKCAKTTGELICHDDSASP